MYCHQCGKQVSENGKFCIYCGAVQISYTPQDVELQKNAPQSAVPMYGAPQYAAPPERKASYKGLFITLGCIPVAVAIAVAVYFIFFYSISPMITLGKAFGNLGVEVEECFEATPLRALVMLYDIFEDGTVTVNFDYENKLPGLWWNTDASGRVQLSSNTATREYTLGADVSVDGESFDIEAHINRERIAARSQLLSDNYYGFRYATFREDIRVFGKIIGLSEYDMDMYADIVDQINDAMNPSLSEEVLFTTTYKAYIDVLTNFMDNIEVTTEKTRLVTGEESVRCSLIQLTITRRALLDMLGEFYDVLENDEALRAQIDINNAPLQAGFYGGTGSTYDELLKQLKEAIRVLERSYTGDIILSFYISRADRLLRAEIYTDIEYDGFATQVKGSFSFGNSIYDTWVFDVTVKGDKNSENIRIEWDYEAQPDKLVNTVRFSSDEIESLALISKWEPEKGDFTLAYISDEESGEISGAFLINDKDFRLVFYNIYPEESSESLYLEIVAKQGAYFEDIDFINIDSWGDAFFNELFKLF